MAAFDLHYGYANKSRHKIPLHDPKALDVFLQFVSDFQPHDIVLGGDILDCGAISHHNHKKPGKTEGLRLLSDAMGCTKEVVAPLESMVKDKSALLTYHVGNHEDWINDLLDREPTLDGLLDLEVLLGLGNWDIIPQGEASRLGKLHFVHGDQVRGGEHVAKAAVTYYERNIRFGHHHTYQAYTKTSALDVKQAKTGVSVPCLCRRDQPYGEGAPNRWAQGFLFGETYPNGDFQDFVAVLVDGKFVWNGKVYKG